MVCYRCLHLINESIHKKGICQRFFFGNQLEDLPFHADGCIRAEELEKCQRI